MGRLLSVVAIDPCLFQENPREKFDEFRMQLGFENGRIHCAAPTRRSWLAEVAVKARSPIIMDAIRDLAFKYSCCEPENFAIPQEHGLCWKTAMQDPKITTVIDGALTADVDPTIINRIDWSNRADSVVWREPTRDTFLSRSPKELADSLRAVVVLADEIHISDPFLFVREESTDAGEREFSPFFENLLPTLRRGSQLFIHLSENFILPNALSSVATSHGIRVCLCLSDKPVHDRFLILAKGDKALGAVNVGHGFGHGAGNTALALLSPRSAQGILDLVRLAYLKDRKGNKIGLECPKEPGNIGFRAPCSLKTVATSGGGSGR
jgi:hypothetical protein